MSYFIGVDIGSTSIKAVMMDVDLNIISFKTAPTGCHFHENTEKTLSGMLRDTGVERDKIRFITATGYGRKLFKNADETVTEITANAVGAKRMSDGMGEINTIINIGGQDAKIIVLDEDGGVKNFVMNDKCAAGTGRFLEVVARNLEIDVSELGDYHMESKGAPISINSTCTVFAESEIISLLANGHPKEDIIAGLHYAIAKRIVRLAKSGGLTGGVFFDGGPAMNKGLVTALEDELMRDIVIPDTPQITTACGAAILAKEANVSIGVSANG